jgi:hypothetical protein
MLDLQTTLVGNKPLLTYLFGVLIIVMYAKDKFNTPTYDRTAMGPFAALPPQLLTIDARYRRGRFVYIFLMACVYTAICIVGPESFSNLMAAAGQEAMPAEAGKNHEVWAVAAAAFLISTGAASDNSILGKIELMIRQYAHKAAYIPSAVSDLAFGLRSLNIRQWLITNPYVDKTELADRKRGVAMLVGAERIAKIEDNPDQEGELAAWVRANILFFILQRMFSGETDMLGAKLDYLTDLEQNRQTFDRIENDREILARQFPPDAEHVDNESGKTFAEVQQLNKETSLMIAVMLSQTARNTNYLNDHLDQLGFQGVDLRDRSDHFTYSTMVNLSILLGAALATLLLVARMFPGIGSHLTWIYDNTFIGLVTVLTGGLIYSVMFKTLDYARDKLLDSLDWQESIESYLKTVLTVSAVSCVVAVTGLVLLFKLIGRLDVIVNGPLIFAQLLIFQFVVAAVGAGFGLYYMRQAARSARSQLNLVPNIPNAVAFTHALIAAFFVAILNYAIYIYNVRTAPIAALGAASGVWESIKSDPRSGIAMIYNDQQLTTITQKLRRQGTLTGIDARLDEIKSICVLLDKPERVAANEAPPLLFANRGTCEVDQQDDPRAGFGNSLAYLSQTLTSLKQSQSPPQIVWFFPAVTAFLIAYGFAIGCRYWRTWWLYNATDRIEELKAQITKSYGSSLDVERCLSFPVGALGNITPIEAIRYEDYRSKLYASVQRRKIVWPADFYREAVPRDPAQDAGTNVVRIG